MRRRLPRAVRVDELAQRFGFDLEGDGARAVDRLSTLESADARSLSFLATARMREAATATAAGAVLVAPAQAGALPASAVRVLTPDPYAAYARVAQWFAEMTAPAPPAGVDPSARVATGARIAPDASIGAYAVVGEGAVIGARCTIGAGCRIGAGTTVGAGTRLHPDVVVYDDCTIGDRVIVHSGTVIGSDGFGFAPTSQGWVKIPQLGGVRIGDDVEIGSNCSIDRGALDDTVIERGCKLDNLIQVAHNVRIGENTAIAACVGIAGSAVIGRDCRFGGGAGIAGHLQICDGVTIGAFTAVVKSITKPGVYTGMFPMMAHADWERAAATLRHLPELRQRLRALEGRCAAKDSE